ncbi:MAG: hypothetical protein RIR57_1180 [Bacteroidota bacterium]
MSFYAFSQTGIGTTTPVNKLDIFSTKADPATSNSSANGNLRLGATGANTHVLDFGLSSTSTFSWLQARDRGNYATLYDLAFNPNGGKVGIGTSAPSSTLTVGNTDGTIPGEITLNPAFTSNEGGQINFKKSLNGSTADWILDQYGTSSTDARLRIFNSIAETNGMAIMENGNIGMGSLTPSVRLQVAGDIIANSIAGSSDLRFKTNITPIENPLQKVLQLRGVNFDWNKKAFPERSFSESKAIGFIAQEVEKVLPEVVQTEKTAEGYKAVQYDKVVALLVEAIKEQQKQIDGLKLELKKQRKKKK